MKILVLNCGSSSIKYQLFNMTEMEVLAKGIVEKVAMKGSFLKYKRNDGHQARLEGEILDHQSGIEYILGILISEEHGIIKDLNEIDAVGHRVAHGGETFTDSAFITDDVQKDIEKCIELAPLHNPHNLKGITAMQMLLPGVPQVGVFDTAFHQSMPKEAYMYAIPYSLYKKYGIRRYGFHGTSHKFVAKRACEILGKDFENTKIITCHLGNGASVAAIKNGKSVDTSMGLTPLEGLIMGTRSGDLDLGVLMFIMEKEEIGLAATNSLLNKHSGMLGITGISSDMREIEDAAWKDKNPRAQLGLDMYAYRVKKYIGAYSAAMGGVDIIIFTGGIGENGPETREDILNEFGYMGCYLDKQKNDNLREKEVVISTEESTVTAMVIPTNEELVIAQDTKRIINVMKGKGDLK